MEKVIIGKVLKPRGLKGELKILLFISEPETLRNLETIFVDGKEYTVKKATPQPGTGIAFLWLDGIDHIDRAEQLRGFDIEVFTDDVEMEEE